ncbi:MAG: aspartate--ammonia ligase [Chitinophagales bacterium]|nr:aspartate--ammonia ligase [Chitinophagales bacterium]
MKVEEQSQLKSKFPGLILPEAYQPSMDVLTTSYAFQQLKNFLGLNFETEMRLHWINAPLFVQKGTGVNDDLNGIERPVGFRIREVDNVEAEVVQSLAKWKRMALAKYNIPMHQGIYTDMHAIRPDEAPDNIHSIFVDQWDWELKISAEDRNIEFLKKTVKKLHAIFRRAESFMHKQYGIQPNLPEKIYFIHSEELLQRYPHLNPSQREQAITKEYGAVFIIGIGGQLSNGTHHDGRSPDYDDWSTPNSNHFFGLNGDYILWHPTLNRAVEISSMGIRVDKESLVKQLELKGEGRRKELLYHKMLLNDELPLTIGGGIGQSRAGMYFLRKVHVGEISVGLWPEEMIEICKEHNIRLL